MGGSGVRLAWDEFLEDIELLAARVQGLALGCSCVMGLSEDGVIPAFLVSKYIGVPYVDGTKALAAKMQGSIVLVVVSVLGKGTRLLPYRQEYKTAALYVRPREALLEPDVALHKIDHWVVFPWE